MGFFDSVYHFSLNAINITKHLIGSIGSSITVIDKKVYNNTVLLKTTSRTVKLKQAYTCKCPLLINWNSLFFKDITLSIAASFVTSYFSFIQLLDIKLE